MTQPVYTAAPSDDDIERIIDAFCQGGTISNKGRDGVVFFDIYQHDAVNHTLSGTIDKDGLIHGFIIDNGNWGGTEIKSWGDPEDVGSYEPPLPPEPRTFIPTNPFLHEERPAMFKVYLHWRTQDWFIKKERGYNYDRHFQPGCAVETHYRDWAATKGMKVGYLSELHDDARAMILNLKQEPV